jgi:hypothetical protein
MIRSVAELLNSCVSLNLEFWQILQLLAKKGLFVFCVVFCRGAVMTESAIKTCEDAFEACVLVSNSNCQYAYL